MPQPHSIREQARAVNQIGTSLSTPKPQLGCIEKVKRGINELGRLKTARRDLRMKQAIAQRQLKFDSDSRGQSADALPSVELTSHAKVTFRLPLNDAAPGALQRYREANEHYRTVPWPAPFDKTTHRLHLADSRDLSFIPDSSVHLVVTSPPYWNLKEYAKGNRLQLGDIEDYEKFLKELDKVWTECVAGSRPGRPHLLRRR